MSHDPAVRDATQPTVAPLVDSGEVEHRRLTGLLTIISCFGCIAALFFGIPEVLRGHMVHGIATLAAAALIFVNLVWLRWSGRLRQALWFGTATYTWLVIVLFVTGGAEQTGFLWSYVLPPTVVFLLGKKGGLWLTFVYLAVVGLVLLLPQHPLLAVDYSAVLLGRYFGSFAFVTWVAVMFEEARVRAQRQLEEEIESRKRIEADMRVAKEGAEQAAAAKATFLATMSHELRTPLGSVIGLTGLLLGTRLDQEQRELAESARVNAEVLLSLINDILDFSKIDAGRLELEQISFSPRTVMENVIDVLVSRACGKGIELVCQLPPDLPDQLVGDPTRLRQVLVNLAGNAVKFTRRGEVVYSVAVLEHAQGAVRLRFQVRDTGPGISAGKLDSLFDSFTQADNSTTRRYGGTGLGLAISKRLVQAMDGEIGVESLEGVGSKFWFTVVCGLDKVAPGPVFPLDLLGGNRFLVALDNQAAGQALAGLLRGLGATPDLAEDRQRLMELLKAPGSAYDLLFLDTPLGSEDTGGRETAPPALLRSAVRHVVLCLPYGQRLDAAALARGGCDSMLVRPVKLAPLCRLLDTVLGSAIAPRLPCLDDTAGQLPEQVDVVAVLAGRRVLVAEDNPTLRAVTAKVLERVGTTVRTVADGRALVEELARNRYDLVLTDIQMPELDGLEATGVIRDPASAVLDHGVPIVAMTAHAFREDRQRFLEAGMDDYIAKPVDPEHLYLVLLRHLGRAPPAAPPVVASVRPAHFDFDRHGLLARYRDLGLCRELVSEFLPDAGERIAKLRLALAGGHQEEGKRIVHALKGAAASFGAMALSEFCRDFEQRLAEGKAPASLDGFEELYERFSLAAENWLQEGEGGSHPPGRG